MSLTFLQTFYMPFKSALQKRYTLSLVPEIQFKMNAQFCPICFTEVLFSPRYPLAVCPECTRRPCDENNRPLVFYNESASGGIAARYADTRGSYPSRICYIDGIKCRADEAYLGGIVIEIL